MSWALPPSCRPCPGRSSRHPTAECAGLSSCGDTGPPSGEGRAWRPFGGPVPQDPVRKMLVGTRFRSCVTSVCFLVLIFQSSGLCREQFLLDFSHRNDTFKGKAGPYQLQREPAWEGGPHGGPHGPREMPSQDR